MLPLPGSSASPYWVVRVRSWYGDEAIEALGKYSSVQHRRIRVCFDAWWKVVCPGLQGQLDVLAQGRPRFSGTSPSW